MTTTIEIKGVSYCYETSDKKALDNLDFRITSGEKTILLGSNGCGKTTLLKVLCGLYQPTEGQILINGGVVKSTPSFNFLVGHVPENPTEMFFESSVEREVEFILKQKKLDEKERTKKVEDILKRFDLFKLKDRTPFELSAGERRKLAIAANIVAEQEFIFLDEPTADLDWSGVETVENFIRESKCGILATTHRTDFARIFDRIVLMNDGHILKDNINLDKDCRLLYDAGVVILRRIDNVNNIY